MDSLSSVIKNSGINSLISEIDDLPWHFKAMWSYLASEHDQYFMLEHANHSVLNGKDSPWCVPLCYPRRAFIDWTSVFPSFPYSPTSFA